MGELVMPGPVQACAGHPRLGSRPATSRFRRALQCSAGETAAKTASPAMTRSEASGSRKDRRPAGPLSPLAAPAQQEHALLAEHVPDPPGQVQRHRAAIEIERDRALHLDVDLVAELHEILDGAEMDVGGVV